MLIISCKPQREYALSNDQAAFQKSIESVKDIDDLFLLEKEIKLQVPDKIIINHSALVFATSSGYVILDNMSKDIKMYSASGELLQVIGKGGEGPGEFRGINVGCVDSQDNIYAYDQLLGRLTVFEKAGKFKYQLLMKYNANIRHLCVNKYGRIFIHKTPEAGNNYFVNVYDSTGYITGLIPGRKEYEPYYYAGFLGGGIVALETGGIMETNTYSFNINKISNDLSVSVFGEKGKYYRELNKERISIDKFTEMQNRIIAHTDCLRFLSINEGKNVIRYCINLGSLANNMAQSPSFYAEIYDTDGNLISNSKSFKDIFTFSEKGGCGYFSYPVTKGGSEIPPKIVLYQLKSAL